MNPGFSLVEVLVCLGILTFGLLPVVTMFHSTTRKGGLSEYHIFFQARATRVLEYFSSFNYDVFKNTLVANGGNEVELPIKTQIQDPALPEEYARKLDEEKYEEVCTIAFEDGARPDLIRLTVELRWKFPLDDVVHSYSLARLYCRPDISLSEDELVLSPDVP